MIMLRDTEKGELVGTRTRQGKGENSEPTDWQKAGASSWIDLWASRCSYNCSSGQLKFMKLFKSYSQLGQEIYAGEGSKPFIKNDTYRGI